MNCIQCGKEVPDGSQVCPYCNTEAGSKPRFRRRLLWGLAAIILAVVIGISIYHEVQARRAIANHIQQFYQLAEQYNISDCISDPQLFSNDQCTSYLLYHESMESPSQEVRIDIPCVEVIDLVCPEGEDVLTAIRHNYYFILDEFNNTLEEGKAFTERARRDLLFIYGRDFFYADGIYHEAENIPQIIVCFSGLDRKDVRKSWSYKKLFGSNEGLSYTQFDAKLLEEGYVKNKFLPIPEETLSSLSAEK